MADIETVYWRRPTSFRLPTHLSEQQRRFVIADARQGLGGLISCLPVPFVNHPSRVADAELKPAQLRAAAENGLVVPPTLITSSGSEARQFAGRFGKVLYKPLTSAFLYEDDQVKLVYATLVEASDIDDTSIALSPCQFQAFIPKSRDIRLVAVGRDCFSVAIYAGSDKSYVDWRADYPALSYEPVETPSHIAEAAAAYLKRFGLAFGCFDFTVSADTGQWVFLECDANAQWGWLEPETGLPIADAIARHLTGDST
ncbi:MAG: ATP-grasp ribosomal peptide maturase [Actinophytocola sp.]|uniref:ATP-grasp ribosomal peptide maturase n=1 Tax=Actinophytocola sp. TaxID=1872138 RepID=UPI0013234128|nr:ATP-grasp ribosomal peptide maturase [Actinophytocola sp.]MPZ85247.1 ATP-grasp ribosomal peptide maturase [Actinophytocola sp.]